MPELELLGCRTRPLAGYLKALGVLRAVSRQVDHSARGRWVGSHFMLSSKLEEFELVEWFVTEFQPATVLSPWNGGGGFYSNNPGAPAALRRIEQSSDPRLKGYREAIEVGRRAVRDLSLTKQPKDSDKVQLVQALRAQWSDEALEWLDAAVVVGAKTVAKLPVLSTGGNEGNFDFSFNYMKAVADGLELEENQLVGSEREAGKRLLREALFDDPAPVGTTGMAHFDRDTSAVMSAVPRTGHQRGNAWELILAIEGSLLLTAGAARRHGSDASASLAAPFTARSTGTGYGSAVGGETGGDEVWLPVWKAPALLSEIESIAREARAQVGGRRSARTGLDFVRASAEMGVARGIDSFERYAMMKRSGKDTLAVPAGRIDVRERPAVQALRSLDVWMDRLARAARGQVPESVRASIRWLDDAVFRFAESGDPRSARQVVIRIGEIESALARSGNAAEQANLRPLRRIPAATWAIAVADGSPEVAAAVGLASIRDRYPQRERLPQLRDYLHGTINDPKGRTYSVGGGNRLNRSLGWPARLAEIHARRHLDSQRLRVDAGRRSSGDSTAQHLGFLLGIPTALAVARGLAADSVDGDATVALAAGLCLFDFDTELVPSPDCDAPVGASPLFDLMVLAWYGTMETPLVPRPDWAARLAAGAWRDVASEAHLRLRLAGLSPNLAASDLLLAEQDGPRLSAGLLLPIGNGERARVARSAVTKSDFAINQQAPGGET